MKRLLLAAVLATIAGPSAAEVKARSADGFTLTYERTVSVGRGDVFLAIESIDAWWDGAHTYSGSAGNLRLEPFVGGCFCEALTDGTTFEHGRVTAFDDDHLRLNAPLGPLNGKAMRADLTFSWPERAYLGDGDETSVILSFVVEGPGLGAFADPVDRVMQGQFDRLLRLIELGSASTEAD